MLSSDRYVQFVNIISSENYERYLVTYTRSHVLYRIPNTHPLKDEMIRREMEKKERMEALKVKQKLDRQSLINSRRKMPKVQSLEQMQQDAAKRGAEFDTVEAPEDDGALAGPGVKETSRTYYKEFRKVVEAADVILQVLDARDPLGCRCRRVEQQVCMCTGIGERESV